MSITKRIKFWFSKANRSLVATRMRKRFCKRKRIKLAVAGSSSSGKSFLLKDINDSLQKMGANFDKLTNEVQYYKDFGRYAPDEFGGNGGTPFYACRSENHYGSAISSTNAAISPFEMDFLNIPGEIFGVAEPGYLSRLQAYINLKDCLEDMPKYFAVTLYTNDSGRRRFIVEPSGKELSEAINQYRESKESILPGVRMTRYMRWSEIFGELNNGHYTACEGSRHKIKGSKLLERFFEYDPDSIMMTIEDLISNGQMTECGFDANTFRNQKYDLAFPFFQYCTLATDLVLCDRLFKKGNDNETVEQEQKKEKGQEQEQEIGELAESMYSFYGKCSKKPHFYLAFRNIDYLLLEKEENYKTLYSLLQNDYGKTGSMNTIYSLFNYVMLNYIAPNFELTDKSEFCEFIGLDEDKLSDSQSIISLDVKKMAKCLVDFTGGSGIIHNDNKTGLASRIKSAIGDRGSSFLRLLTRGGYVIPDDDDDNPMSTIAPHVYFTCTPITGDFDMYRNYITTNEFGQEVVASDFEREIPGQGKSFFSKCHSKACFGSYQLCMDILTQHNKGSFSIGSLLKVIQGNIG